MSQHDWSRVKRSLEPEWNDLREQRVLARVQEEKRRRLAQRPRTLYFVVAAAAVVLLAVIGLKLRKQPVDVPVATPPAADPKMLLADGSEVALVKDAQVKVEEQGEERVRITQSAGEARYDVRPNPKRRFAVRVGDVTVRVLGTAFTVTLANDKVRVHVLRGRVEVEGGGKTTELAIGETLEVPAVHAIEAPAPTAAPTPIEKKAAPTVEALLAKADEARAAHRYDEAATALRTMISGYPGDPRVASALFTLGRVERARGKHAAAAEAFARCHKVAPHGSLAEDALAEEAVSWKSAGDGARARSAAQRYLKLHPGGAHVARMMPLTE